MTLAVQLRVAKLEKNVSELKKIDHSAKALAALKSQVPMINLIQEILSVSQLPSQDKNPGNINNTLATRYLRKIEKDGLAGQNQGKKTKRRRTKELESSKKPSTTKENPKGKAPSKGYKTGKYASAKEPVEEPIAEVVMDDAGEDVVHDNDQPQHTSEPKTTKTPNPKWFKQPPRPPTPDPEWNKHQVILSQHE
ncbi:hypothetical protein Tco_0595490 [Tanacetum coccineum]